MSTTDLTEQIIFSTWCPYAKINEGGVKKFVDSSSYSDIKNIIDAAKRVAPKDAMELMYYYSLVRISALAVGLTRQVRPLLRQMVVSEPNAAFKNLAQSNGEARLETFLRFRKYWGVAFEYWYFRRGYSLINLDSDATDAIAAEEKTTHRLLSLLDADELKLKECWSEEMVQTVDQCCVIPNFIWIEEFHRHFQQLAMNAGSEEDLALASTIGHFVLTCGPRARCEASDEVAYKSLGVRLNRKNKITPLVRPRHNLKWKGGIAYYGDKPALVKGVQMKLLKALTTTTGPRPTLAEVVFNTYDDQDRLSTVDPIAAAAEVQRVFKANRKRFRQLVRDLARTLKSRHGWDWHPTKLIEFPGRNKPPMLTLHPEHILSD